MSHHEETAAAADGAAAAANAAHNAAIDRVADQADTVAREAETLTGAMEELTLELLNRADSLKRATADLADGADAIRGLAGTGGAAGGGHGDIFMLLTVFVLAVFVGYYVVWRVTPALHSPLMAVTNAVSSVIIVGALIAAGPAEFGAASLLGFLAVTLASVNIFGGFLVTQRMLAMFKKKDG